MATRRKPFRTLKSPFGAPDHFTIEQADAAVLAVMAERGETPVFDPVEGTSDFPVHEHNRRRGPWAQNGRL